ncbi:hypothetical protein RGE_21950 [Rubrivivax gelatinosus IL144]|uniref:Uncharacterized protein n=1 Tax=Rubrivivax gelatinosus (strain NBRC 100245 / IL144) TaxID=983917 RepID=I0HR99_RUBGI|nr:hypothetical protein RGE_21950 [Rubrivivax gelatinosus IL144]
MGSPCRSIRRRPGAAGPGDMTGTGHPTTAAYSERQRATDPAPPTAPDQIHTAAPPKHGPERQQVATRRPQGTQQDPS